MLDRDAHLIPAGQIILADKGFAGREFDAVVTGAGRSGGVHPVPASRAQPCQ
jgi:hypothetical protein